jgi:hypothetical protein
VTKSRFWSKIKKKNLLHASASMPKLSCRSQQAKAQRASGKWGFYSGLTDNPFEHLLDPDYNEPSTDDTDENNDSRNELMCKYAFSLGQEKEIIENGDSEEGEDSEGSDLKEDGVQDSLAHLNGNVSDSHCLTSTTKTY